METNGTVAKANENVAALAALIQSADLTKEQRAALLLLSRPKEKKRFHHHRHGPRSHCKQWDKVTASYPDGSSEVLNVCRAWSRSLHLTNLTQEGMAATVESNKARMRDLGRLIQTSLRSRTAPTG